MILSTLFLAAVVNQKSASSAQSEWVVPIAQGGNAFPYDDVKYLGSDVHDPSIVQFGDQKIMFATSRGDFVPLWTSKDGLKWIFGGPVLPEFPEWLKRAIPQQKSVWAPAPIRLGNKLRVYYCASLKFGSNTSFIGLVENLNFDPKQPTKGWLDRGMLVESDEGKSDFNAIDPDVMMGPDGRQWMVYGSYWGGIYQRELDPSTGLLKDPSAAHVHVASNADERGNPLEAPTQCYHDGKYYLFVTYGLAAQGIRSTYRMMVGRSDQPAGPYLGQDGRSMAEGGHTDLLKSSPPMFGPGGGNVFQDKHGEWWLAYHFYDATRHWRPDMWGRPTLQMRKIVWQDGWPLPGLPFGIELLKPKFPSIVGVWRHQADFSDTAEMTIAADGSMTVGQQHGTWKREGDQLHLFWPSNVQSQAATDSLKLDETEQFYVGRNQAGRVIRGIKVNAKVRQF